MTTPQPPEDGTPRKPGFFSRLFTARQVAPPPEADDVSDVDVIPGTNSEAITQELRVDELREALTKEVEVPEGFDATPGTEPTQAPKKKGLFARWFGGEEKPSPPAAPLPPAPTPAVEPIAPRKSWFERLRDRLRGGSGSFMGAVRRAIGLSGRLDDDTLEQLEEILVAADVGMDTTLKIVNQLKARAKAEDLEGAEAIMQAFREVIAELLEGNTRPFAPTAAEGPYVVAVVGVNGVGKTTTIGKMAKRCSDAGLRVMVVAGDTFRAAAVEQLEIWASRTGAEFIKGNPGADPSGLVFDAMTAAKARGIDVVFIDTAGRLQTKTTLMAELGKVMRVASRVIPDAPHETLLVLDATTGQNAISQTKAFSEAVAINGIVMTKLDGTAKGGVLLTLRDQFDIPVTLVGVGEGVDDLRDFDPRQFAAALFAE